MSQEVKGRLLIVDADPDARQMVDGLLFREGYETRCAPDGKTALMFAEADPPELILLDVRLPDLDGFEVCRRLKSSDKTDRIPVVFLSGLDDVGDKIWGFESGGVDYITKPFQAAEVLARVDMHLALHRLRKQAETQNIVLDAMVQERTRELTEITESLVREIVQREKADEALEERLRFERILSDLSARLVSVPSKRLDGEIENALKTILEYFQVERCGLIRILPDRKSWQLTHAAIAEAVPPVPLGMEFPFSIFPFACDRLIRKREVHSFSSLDDLPPEADVDRQTSIEWGIRSCLYIPIVTEEPVAHIIAIDSVMNERVWPEEFIPRLRLLGEIFVNALERRKGELALRKSEERLSLAAASAEARLWELDLSTEVIWTTDKGRNFYGLATGEELTFVRFLSYVHPEDRERIRESIEKARSGMDLSVEYRVAVSERNFRWIASRGGLSVDSSGKQDRVMGVSIDITERKRMEGELQLQLEEIERLKLQLEKENLYLREELSQGLGFEKIVGSSDALNYVLFRVGQVAPTDATVLILGETGTGKGMVANAIHGMSGRKDRPMITVNCAALPANLIESELFGREKGAFTGAHARQAGRFEVADKRDDLSRRDRRAAAGAPVEAPAGAPGRRVRKAGKRENGQGGREGDRLDEPRPEGGGPCRTVPGGPLLPAQRVPRLDPAAPEAGRRYPAARPLFHGQVFPQDRQADRDHPEGRHEGPGGILVARQREGAGACHRTGRDHDNRSRATDCRSP